MDQILETTGYWNYNQASREYMSLFDMMELTLPKKIDEPAPIDDKPKRKSK
jgi:hypothetical protein